MLRHGGNLRVLSETTDMDSYSETVHELPLSSAALTAVAILHLQPVHCDISVPSPAQSTLPFYWRLFTFIHSQWLLTVVQLEATRGHSRHVHVVRSLLNYATMDMYISYIPIQKSYMYTSCSHRNHISTKCFYYGCFHAP